MLNLPGRQIFLFLYYLEQICGSLKESQSSVIWNPVCRITLYS
jgi:hypothetical protein